VIEPGAQMVDYRIFGNDSLLAAIGACALCFSPPIRRRQLLA
jgi:hypothetical protein